MSMPTTPPFDPLDIVFASDEQIYIEASSDWGVIVPRSSRAAYGTDGTIAKATPWTLTAPSNDFGDQGVQSGMVISLTAANGKPLAPTQFYAIDTVSGTSVTLRRCGFATGLGQAPSPTTDLTGVTFEALTLLPQIESVAYALEEQYSIDPTLANRRPDDIYDQRVFRRLTACRVLFLRYLDANRSKQGDFADKIKLWDDEYHRELDAAIVRWGPTGTRQPPTTRFGTRLSR